MPVSDLGRSLRAKRAAWNIGKALSEFHVGGYQYSAAFLEWLWRPAKHIAPHSAIINCFQLYPPSIVKDPSVEKWFFIDQTLSQLFESGLYGKTPSRAALSKLIPFETANYQAAAGIVTHSHWAARSVKDEYGINPAKIHVVVPGANLEQEDYDWWGKTASHLLSDRNSRIAAGRPRLVFVGKDWRRKGLLRLIDAVVTSKPLGISPTLRVLGCNRNELPSAYRNVPDIEWFGFVDKRDGTRQFIKSVGECDIGCLLSRAEAGGIVLREYHALGLATLAADVGGVPDHVIPRASVLIPSDMDPTAIAQKLALICRHDANIAQRAWTSRKSALWQESIVGIASVWPHTSNAQLPVAAPAHS
jgi:glycosyltransferase involved in cell wall biosynthesis